MTESKLNGAVAIPRWFLWFLTAAIGIASTGGVPWAWRVQSNIAKIEANGSGLKDMLEVQTTEIRRRLDRIEARLDRQETKD